jgi:CRISPR/Cas system-associated exonuclease Cas4 (RecB family)
VTGTARSEPFIWGTWIAKHMDGSGCPFQLWLMAHRQKMEKVKRKDELDLQQWTIEHAAAVANIAASYRAQGFAVTVEDENAAKYKTRAAGPGAGAVISFKPDIIAVKNSDSLVIDVKTGKRRDSDVYQVQLYQCLGPQKCIRALDGHKPAGLIIYPDGEVPIPADSITAAFKERVRQVLEVACASTPPKAAPGSNCNRCHIVIEDCPDRREVEQVVGEGDI